MRSICATAQQRKQTTQIKQVCLFFWGGFFARLANSLPLICYKGNIHSCGRFPSLGDWKSTISNTANSPLCPRFRRRSLLMFFGEHLFGFPLFHIQARYILCKRMLRLSEMVIPCFRDNRYATRWRVTFRVCTSVSSPTTHEPEAQQIPTPARVFVVLRTFYSGSVKPLTATHSLSVCISGCLSIALGHQTRLVCHSYRQPRSAPSRQQTSKKIMLIKSRLISIYTTATGLQLALQRQ